MTSRRRRQPPLGWLRSTPERTEYSWYIMTREQQDDEASLFVASDNGGIKRRNSAFLSVMYHADNLVADNLAIGGQLRVSERHKSKTDITIVGSSQKRIQHNSYLAFQAMSNPNDSRLNLGAFENTFHNTSFDIRSFVTNHTSSNERCHTV